LGTDQLTDIRKKYAGKTFATRRAALFNHAPASLRVYFGSPGELEPALAAQYTEELQQLGALDKNRRWRDGGPVPIAQIASDGEPEALSNCFAFLFFDPRDAKRPVVVATTDEWSGEQRLADLSKLALTPEADPPASHGRAAPPLAPSDKPIPKGIDAGGIYVFCGPDGARLRPKVIAEVRGRWSRATPLGKGDPRAVRTDIHSCDERLAYAVSQPRDGWILVADSSGDCADFKLAKRLSKKLITDVVWWMIAAGSRDGALRRIGTGKPSRCEGYEEVARLVAALPFGWSHFPTIAEQGEGYEFFAFDPIDANDYDFGPMP
jgi:hypothetical protein